jgi:rhodanese-related sulfurtransferase
MAAGSKEQLHRMIIRAAAIGYETSIAAAVVITGGKIKEAQIDITRFKKYPKDYTIVDVRNDLEVKEGKIFPGSISIPLTQLVDRLNEIPTDKPIVVHCAAGYRSAAASSLIHSKLNGTVSIYNLGEAVKEFGIAH